jgi:ribosomal protein S14
MSRSAQWLFLDILKRKLFLKHEIKRFLLKSLKKNSTLPLIYRYFVFYQKNKLPRWAALPQIVNRCVKTGRSFSVQKKTRISRFLFRRESYCGHLPGFKRASW